jgi:hypothetical protein
MILLLVALFNAILRTQYFPPVWKHARVISILKPGKDPTLPSSYRPISLLDTIGKVFENILLRRILSKVSGRGLLRDEQFGFRPKQHILAAGPPRWKFPGTLARSGSEVRFSLMWPRHLTPYGSTALPTSLWLSTFPLTWWKLYNPTCEVGRSKRPPLPAVAQGRLVSPVLFSL